MTGMRMALAGALVLSWLGCADERGPINQVQTNVVAKDIFQGSWYMTATVIDVDYEASSVGAFEGDSADDYSLVNNPWGGDTAINYNIARVRWVIDKDFLYAFRDYELVQMTDASLLACDDKTTSADCVAQPGCIWQDRAARCEADPTGLGEPLAIYAIESHFDIQRSYNPTTREETNIVVENATDRRWYDRQYIRVDWSKNLTTSYLFGTRDLYEMFGLYKREAASFQLEPGSPFPESWKPTFRRNSCSGWEDTTCDEQDRDSAGDYDLDELYYMSFVNQEIFTPGEVEDPYGRGMVPFCASPYSDSPMCTSNLITIRYGFLKRSPKRQYEPLNYDNVTHHDHFAYFRNERPVFDRSEGRPSDPQRDVTDLYNYTVNRHNMWRQWFDEDGNRLPYTEREVRPIVFYTTADMPYHHIKSSFQVAADWNLVFMRMVRRLRGLEVPPDSEYNPWDPTEDAYDCHIVNAAMQGGDALLADPTDEQYSAREREDSAIFDDDFAGWRTAQMEGSECVVVPRVNGCIRDETLPCQERGDPRYKFLSYVQQPGTPFLGVATMRGDPLTGETITGDANIGGPALDGLRTFAMQTYDMAAGNLDEEEFWTGESVRKYYENLGRIERPSMPIIDFRTAAMNAAPDPYAGIPGLRARDVKSVMQQAFERTAPLRSRDRLPLPGQEMRQRMFEGNVGQRLLRSLTDNPDTLALNGIESAPDGLSLTDEYVSRFSPLATPPHERERRMKERQLAYALRTMEFAPPGYDWSILRYVEQRQNWPRAKVVFELARELFVGTESHELGHCMGMRHQFGASADWRNFDDRYFEIAAAHPWPDSLTFDDPNNGGDGDGVLNAEEERAYQDAYLDTKHERDSAGIAAYTASSTMEYTSDWYEDESAMGKFDNAAILFAYGELAEVYDNSQGAQPDEIDPLETRSVWKYFAGGDVCESDSDCPYNAAGEHGDELITGQVEQRCVSNPQHPNAGNICSNFYDDLAASNAEGQLDKVAVRYNSCEDLVASTNSEPGCMMFDRGTNFVEVVTNFRERYDRDYLRNNFRRYRRAYPMGYFDRIWGRNLGLLRAIYGNLWYRYTYEPDFANDTGAFGFLDQYAASVDILNFYAEIIAQPQIGSYTWNENRNLYQLFTGFPNHQSAELSLDIGLGKYFYATYQSGLTGISRLEKMGVIWDKVAAIEALLVRYWGDEFGTDLAPLTNFYDLFPNETSQLLSGMIRNETVEYAPRVICDDGGEDERCEGVRLQYVNWYRGDCQLGIGSGACRPDPVSETYADLGAVDFGGSFLSQIYATLYALLEIPVWYDTSFLNQLDICVEGQADCFRISPDMVQCDLEEDPECESSDYVRYTSDRFHRSWVALNVDVAPNAAISSQTIGFDIVREAELANRQWRWIQGYLNNNLSPPGFRNADAAADEANRLKDRVEDLESFMGQILEWQRAFGIQYSY